MTNKIETIRFAGISHLSYVDSKGQDISRIRFHATGLMKNVGLWVEPSHKVGVPTECKVRLYMLEKPVSTNLEAIKSLLAMDRSLWTVKERAFLENKVETYSAAANPTPKKAPKAEKGAEVKVTVPAPVKTKDDAAAAKTKAEQLAKIAAVAKNRKSTKGANTTPAPVKTPEPTPA